MTDAGLPNYSIFTTNCATNTNLPDFTFTEIKGGIFRIESGVTLRIGQSGVFRIGS